MEQAIIYIFLAAAFGLFMAWGIGANDASNAMAPSVGSRALTIRQAILIAAIFEFAGAVLAGGGVTSTIRRGLIDTSLLEGQPELLVFGMLSSLLAAGTWLLVASARGWPVSTTHTIIGAVVGFAAIGIGPSTVQWMVVVRIVFSWVISPLMAGILAWALFSSVQRLVFEHEQPLRQARRWVPVYMFLAGFFMALVTLDKGLKHIDIHLSLLQSLALSAAAGGLLTAVGTIFVLRIPDTHLEGKDLLYHSIERIFAILMVVTACAMAFAHGSNDVANAIGPMAAVISVASTGSVEQQSVVPIWILVLGGVGIVIGLATYGHKVIATVGTKITALTPSRGFAAGLAAAATIVLASGTGLPISTTHTVVGAILGVGLARGIAAINLRTVSSIFMSWVITIPAGAILAVIFFIPMRALLG